MPALRNYHLFISHAWKYDDDYRRLVNLLNTAPHFRWSNYSVPQHNPLDANNTRKLEKELQDQIRPSSVVLVISGMYVNYREWIEYEIEVAEHYGKPIVGIRPRGAERIPVLVNKAAKEMVNWNTNSIVAAIRRCAL